MKKNLIIFPLTAFLVLLTFFIVKFWQNKDKSDWICQNNNWIKVGNPKKPMPKTPCGDQKKSLLNKPDEFNNRSQNYKVYQTDDFVVKYPNWQDIDKKNLFEPEKTKLAVTDGFCNFVVTSVFLPSNTNFKEYIQKELKNQESLSKYSIKINFSDIQELKSQIEGEFTINATELKSISYSYLTSKRQIYSIVFIAQKNLFANSCRPIIEEITASVKAR